jgi:hypothetical protein
MSDQHSGNSMLSPGMLAGTKFGCPFCLAKSTGVPKVGETIRKLGGYRPGLVGTVVPTPPLLVDEPHIIVIRVDNEPPDVTWMVNTRSELIERWPGPPVPDWAPPIPLVEAKDLDDLVVQFCERSMSSRSWRPNLPYFYSIIRYIWYKRLPLEPLEVWEVLQAHGVPKNWQVRLTSLFKEGRDLLVFAEGRKPIKKKRVQPLSA